MQWFLGKEYEMGKVLIAMVLVSLGAIFFSVHQQEKMLMLDVEKLIVQVNEHGDTITKDCGPVFGKTVWQKSLLLKSGTLLTLTMQRDFTDHQLGFSPTDYVKDILEIETMKSNFKVTLSGGFEDQEKDYNGMKMRERSLLETQGDKEIVRRALMGL